MIVSKLASAIFNEVVSGLSGTTASINIPIQQLEDEVVLTRLSILHKWSLQNLLPTKDLYYTLTPIEVDCRQLSAKCKDYEDDGSEEVLHFELPQIAFGTCGEEAVQFIGSTDKSLKFKVYTDISYRYHRFSRLKRKRPYVYIDTTPNANNRFDCYIFDCPFIEAVTAVIIPKDPRDLEEMACCNLKEADNYSDIALETKDTVTAKYIKYFRQLIGQPLPTVNTPGGVVLGASQPQS